MKLSWITRVEIKFPDLLGEEMDVPDIVLEQIVMVLQANLRQASGMRAELSEMLPGPGVGDFSMPNCYPNRKVEGEGHHRKDIRWLFVHLFERLVVYSPKAAAAIASTWPLEDSYFFQNLKLFALNHRALFDIDQTYASIQELYEDAFWDYNNRRELLFLLEDRWPEFTAARQLEIANRILAGPPKPDHMSGGAYPEWKDDFAASYCRFLTLQGCVFPNEASDRLDTIIASLPKWSDDRATGVVTLRYGLSGSVQTDDNPEGLLDQPVNEIVERAKEHS